MHPPLVRRFNVRIPLRDGIMLAADLVLPAISGRRPAVVMRTPYGRGGELATERADAFAKAGLRGGLGRRARPRRLRRAVRALPERRPRRGRRDRLGGRAGLVRRRRGATYGGSYPGRIQWFTALHQPPALRAMIVLVTPADPFVENPTGVPGPMHIHWYRMTDGRRSCSTPTRSTGWRSTGTGRSSTSTTPRAFIPRSGARNAAIRRSTTTGSRSATSTASRRSTCPCCTSRAGTTTRRSRRPRTSPR